MKIIITLISLSLISCSTSIQKAKRSLASNDSVIEDIRVFMLNSETTIRVEDKNKNLEPITTLETGDIIKIKMVNSTSPRTYINDGDIYQSNNGWYFKIEILQAKFLDDYTINELNSNNLFISKSITKRATELDHINEGFDCEIVSKGCLLIRDSETVVIFFRGWVPDNRYGSRKQVSRKNWKESAREMMFNGNQLGRNIDVSLASLGLESSIFTLASSHLSLTMNELDIILERSNATKVIFASHSGGQVGLRQTILGGDYEYWESKVKAIWMLDNFYSAARTSEVIYRNFFTNFTDKSFLSKNCFGFVTAHNMDNYKNYYKKFCPKVLTRGVGHSDGVIKCLPAFEKGERCTP